jgi:hypothetical protein
MRHLSSAKPPRQTAHVHLLVSRQDKRRRSPPQGELREGPMEPESIIDNGGP